MGKLTINDMQKIAEGKGGKCLSKKYVNNHTKLSWSCNQCHFWEASPQNIKAGKWCPTCAIKKRADKKRLTIGDMQKKAVEKRGKCISEKYVDAHTKLEFQCEFGHRFWATPNQVNMGSWCRLCGIKRAVDLRRSSIEEMQKIANNRGGKCLSAKYVDIKTPLLWQCNFGHTWNAMPINIKSKKSWCPHCSHNAKLTLEDMQQIAKIRGGECLSNKYLGAEKKLRWKCKEGHEWENTPGHIKFGQWCPLCANKKRGVKTWTDDETKLLVEKYPISNKQELSILFPDKTYAKIKNKAKTLKLVKQSFPFRGWKKEEYVILTRLYYHTSKEDILKFLPHRKWEAIRQRALKLGLSRSPKFQKDSVKGIWKNEEYRKNMTILGRETYKRNKEKFDGNLKKGIEYTKKHAKEMFAKRMSNPDYRKDWEEAHKRYIHSKENLEHLRKMTSSEEGRKRSSIKMKTRWLDPKWRKIIEDLWSDPEFRAKNARGIARAAKEGSKVEKYVFGYITKALSGVEVKFKDWSVLKHQEIDISIPSIKLAIEVQGPLHFFPIHGKKHLEQQEMRDFRKHEKLKELGWKQRWVSAALQFKTSEIEAQCDAIIQEILGFENWKPPQRKLV